MSDFLTDCIFCLLSGENAKATLKAKKGVVIGICKAALSILPYSAFRWEHKGAVYQRLGIRHWQSRIPDMSRILPGIMPAKKISGPVSRLQLETMLRETCVAEWIHALLGLLGFGCLRLWPGPGGVMVSVLYLLGNLPFILVQRFNRPRLVRLLHRGEGRAA